MNSVIFLQQKIPNLPRPASLSAVTSESRVDRWLHNCSPWNFGEAGLGCGNNGCFYLDNGCFFLGILYIWHFMACVNLSVFDIYMYIHPWYHMYIYMYSFWVTFFSLKKKQCTLQETYKHVCQCSCQFPSLFWVFRSSSQVLAPMDPFERTHLSTWRWKDIRWVHPDVQLEKCGGSKVHMASPPGN